MTITPNPHQLAVLADKAEALAYADFFAAAPSELRQRLALSVQRVADATLLLAPGLPVALFNRAIGLGLCNDAGLEDVEEIVARFREAGVADWRLLWSPLARPQDLLARLDERGLEFRAVSHWAKMYRGTDSPPPIASALTVAPASRKNASQVARVITDAFSLPSYVADWIVQLQGRPNWTLYAVMDGDTIVGGASLFLAGELAWLGMGAVAAPYRRRGGQGALMARRIEDAIARSACHIFTETGEPVGEEPNPSFNNMERCGFVKVVSRSNLAGRFPSEESASR
ncbi:GNAT family N-acetyltransferase [Paraburkholderia sp. 2C]|jgi:hypothetical protein